MNQCVFIGVCKYNKNIEIRLEELTLIKCCMSGELKAEGSIVNNLTS